MIINRLKLIVFLWISLLLTGCDGIGTIPVDKQNYIGTWYGQYMVLTITPDARVDYKYQKGNASTSLDAPIVEFIGDDFKAGALGIYTTFVVSTAPYYEDGVWKMVVDNQLVIRKASSQSSLIL